MPGVEAEGRDLGVIFSSRTGGVAKEEERRAAVYLGVRRMGFSGAECGEGGALSSLCSWESSSARAVESGVLSPLTPEEGLMLLLETLPQGGFIPPAEPGGPSWGTGSPPVLFAGRMPDGMALQSHVALLLLLAFLKSAFIQP